METVNAPLASLWSTDDGSHLIEVQTPPLNDRLNVVARRSRTIEHGQRAVAAVTIAAALWYGFTFGGEDNDFAGTLLAHAWVLAVVGGIGLFVGRSLPARRLVGFMLTGFFFIPVLVDIAHGPLTRWAGEGTNWASAGVVPVVEELLKALPLFMVAVGIHRDSSRSISVLDFGLAGFALGAGFAIHEDLLWDRTIIRGFDGSAGLLAPSVVIDPLLVVGHAGWTALVGLGLGIAVVHRGRGPAWLAAVLGIALAVGDHAAANHRGDVDVRAWVLDGRLAVAALAVGLAAACISGLVVERWARARDRVFPPVPATRLISPSALLLPAGEYARARSMAHTDSWRRAAPGYEAAAQPHVPILLYEGATRAGLVVDPSAATGPPHRDRGDRRRTHPLALVAMAVVTLGIAVGVWSAIGGDPGGESARGEGSGRPQPDPGEDSAPQSYGGDSEKDEQPGFPSSGGIEDLDPPLAIVWAREDDSGRSTVIAARDDDRQIVRSNDLVILRDGSGGYYCVLTGRWSCGDLSGDPWMVGNLRASYVPDPSMAGEGGDGTVRNEVFATEIAGRPATCHRQSIDEESSEFCVDVERFIVLRNEERGTSGTFGASETSLVAIEVRDPRPADFELPPDLDLEEAME